MALGGIVAVIVVIALIMGLVRVAQWRLLVEAAEGRQAELSAEYGFDPGDIISDSSFFDANAMSRAEIQAFLTEKGSSCSGDGCLRTKVFDTSAQKADSLCGAYAADAGNRQTAAGIIAKAAKACSISPEVLLVMLQKEQHLVTATSTTDFQYEAAMGLSCPDTADCDPAYAGFFKQVFGAAKRLRYYLAHGDRYGYKVGSLSFVRYSPDSGCGGANVVIRGTATRLLYIYTPYQPNVAALKAGAGEGDSCSSYGNRNFWLIYTGWFGSTG